MLRVAVDGIAVCGYALVCTRPIEYERWLRRRALSFLVRTGVATMSPLPSGQFLRLRVADGWHRWRDPFRPPMGAHAHLNAAPGARNGSAARMLVDHIDTQCRRAGVPGWFGEINAPVGRRAAALARLGITVVHRTPNATMSWLGGEPVERLTVLRHVKPAASDGHQESAKLIA